MDNHAANLTNSNGDMYAGNSHFDQQAFMNTPLYSQTTNHVHLHVKHITKVVTT